MWDRLYLLAKLSLNQLRVTPLSLLQDSEPVFEQEAESGDNQR